MDCTSGEPTSAQYLNVHLQARDVAFLDAPVSGQTIGAEKGTLTVMVGGDAEALQRARPAIEPFAGLIQHVGDSGSGFAVKAVNN
ncbi:NAD(P)-binding domain-containing protein, partial [Klebsiella pneumoniae]|nr:NAD(P)-binding domain-containing protein [Klebsiella pneumoniae]